ncbi:MAG: hypothetical protein JKY71_03775 [Alphaproteobacteria bacterium]|nr:hypothetical protein [Alphaproteobacteria bacterium]
MKKLFLVLVMTMFPFSYSSAEDVEYVFEFIPAPYTKDWEQTAVITGDSCDDLKIKSYGADWYPEKPFFVGKAACFPKVENLPKYLEPEKVRYISKGVELAGGPIIYAVGPSEIDETTRDEKLNDAQRMIVLKEKEYKVDIETSDAIFVEHRYGGRFMKVQEIYPCAEDPNDLNPEFCATVDVYEQYPPYGEEYFIFCTDCSEIKDSEKALQNTILGYYGIDGGILLEDGLAFPKRMNPAGLKSTDYFKLYQSLKQQTE